MFVAAMVDALPALAAPVLAELAAVRSAGEATPGFAEASSGGLRARRFGLAAGAPHRAYRVRRARSASSRRIGTRACGHGVCRASSPRIDGRSAVRGDARACAGAARAARRRGSAGARHPVDDVHFHELADWDSLLDVVAAGCIAAALAGARWTASSLPLGGGTVRTAHGLLPVPAPATSAAARRAIRGTTTASRGERVTPTGAAILRHLVPAAHCGGRREAGRLVGTGSGAGTRTLPGCRTSCARWCSSAPVADRRGCRCRRRGGARVRRRRHDRRGNRAWPPTACAWRRA